MENKRGKWQMKWQLSNKGKRKAGRAADGNAAPGEEEGPSRGWSGKEGAAHDTQRRAGPAGGWRRGSTLMLQRAFCGGAGWGWDLCHGCPQVTGGARVKSCCAQEIPAKTPLLHWFHSRNGDFTLWESGSQNGRGAGGGSMFSMTGCGYLTCRKPTRDRTWGGSEGAVSGTTRCPTGIHILLLPRDAGATSRRPPTAEVRWDLQEPMWKKGINRALQCFLWGWRNLGPSYMPWSSAGFPKGRGGSRAASRGGSQLQPGHSRQPGGARPHQGSAARPSASFLGAEQKSKMPSAKNHV